MYQNYYSISVAQECTFFVLVECTSAWDNVNQEFSLPAHFVMHCAKSTFFFSELVAGGPILGHTQRHIFGEEGEGSASPGAGDEHSSNTFQAVPIWHSAS